MDANSIDNPVCVNAVGLSGVDRQSAGSQGSVTDHSGGRQPSSQLNPRPGLFRLQISKVFLNSSTRDHIIHRSFRAMPRVSPAADQCHEESA